VLRNKGVFNRHFVGEDPKPQGTCSKIF